MESPGSVSLGNSADDEKRPLICETGTSLRRAPRTTRHQARRTVAPSLVCGFGTVRRRAHENLVRRGSAFAVPATLAFPLSRGGLLYPLASLDISGQWPVFEQEPHRNRWSALVAVNASSRDAPAIVGLSSGNGKSVKRITCLLESGTARGAEGAHCCSVVRSPGADHTRSWSATTSTSMPTVSRMM